ncbi:protease pro-enzyme activation domain-containing protein [Streptacidiphilus sp. P02-A3a]|uniref:protease pro-enzyme activation domain-containing protein n=1 Tax=Streptacidiphilus sp. P02-A3a TaxID=2704468 RepID=UPI0015FCE0D8|nr:protease pro-enzyme activation domain-containing protein [Streptacidiphilus sp. P02-A3a]QMU73025.1 hypothetical protein GXP74_37070 [Streptacidiphilus sp. P02-A3a]
MTDKVTAVPGGSIAPAPGRRRTTNGGSRYAMRVAFAASTAALALVATSATADAAGLSAAATATAAANAPQRIGTAPQIPAGAVRATAPSGSTTVQLSVGLNPRQPAALKAYAAAVSTKGNSEYHHYLAKGQFGAVFGPTQDTVNRVVAALRARGLKTGTVTPDGLTIPVTTDLATAAKAFGTSFAGYKLANGAQAFANTEAPELPESVAGTVSGVIGLDSLSARSTDLVPATPNRAGSATTGGTPHAAATPDAGGGPQICSAAATALTKYGTDGAGWTSASRLASTYNLPHTATSGAGVTIGVLELENYSPSDFAAYQACYGTHVTVSTVATKPAPTAAPNYGSDIGTESLLDLEDLASLAPGASIIDYETANTRTGTGLPTDLQAMVTADDAQVLSISWGNCEYAVGGSSLVAEDYYAQEAAAQGQSIFAAAGDYGGTDCAPLGSKFTYEYAASVNDPASQPFVTAVGGTSLPSHWVWNDGAGGGAGGGGVSNAWNLSPSFDYQTGFAGSGYTSQCSAPSGGVCRQLPDVSALADEQEGYPIYAGGAWHVWGGTSASTPTWAALTAIADAQPGCSASGPLGFLNFALYQAAKTGYSSNYRDVTTGNNVYNKVGYSAKAGYDLASGLGEPDAANLIPVLCADDPAAATGPGTYHPVTPTRILDTRPSKQLVPSGGMTSVQIEGDPAISQLDIPSSGVTSVVMNVTVTSTTGAGNLTAWGYGTTRPKTSNVNWTGKGQTVANLVTVPVSGDGGVDFYITSSAAVIGDIQGYYTKDTTGSTYTTMSPTRILDSRGTSGTNPPIVNNTINLNVVTPGGVPADATAVVVNLTATGTTGAGNFAAYPTGTAFPGVSNVDWYQSNSTVAGLAIVPLGTNGQISVKVAGSTQVIADVFGYFTLGTGGASFTGVTPTRLLDTRSSSPVAAGHMVTLQITGNPKITIPSGIKAVVLNITVTGTTGSGFLSAGADDGSGQPPTSNLNWVGAKATVPNQVIVPVAADGKVDLYVNSTTQVIADVFGYYL